MLSADGNCELFSLKVLMVEDEEKIPAFVRKGREARGFDTSVVENDDDSYALAHGGTLELLDIMLPGRDGRSIQKELWASGCSTPVIILTARTGDPSY